MKSHPKRLYHTSRIVLMVGACLALTATQFSVRSLADDGYIDAPAAIVQLHKLALSGEAAQVELEAMDGREVVVFANVCFTRFHTNKSVSFSPHYTRRPKAETTLVEEYLEEKLGRPLTDSSEDRKLTEKAVIRVLGLKASDNVMVDGNDRYLVKGIKELDMSGLPMPVAMTVKAVKLPPDDPWIGDGEDEPSNWKIEYRIDGFPEPFRYRIAFRENPKRAPIDSVTVHPAAWRFDTSRQQHIWGIRITMRQGANKPYGGFFELDDYGYPVEAKFVGSLMFDEELSKRLSPRYRWALWVKNHEFDSPADAWDACPGKVGNRRELGEILYELLESTQNPDIRLQVLGAIQASRAVEKRMIPLIERSLDSPYDDEVATARFILDRYNQEKARGY